MDRLDANKICLVECRPPPSNLDCQIAGSDSPLRRWPDSVHPKWPVVFFVSNTLTVVADTFAYIDIILLMPAILTAVVEKIVPRILTKVIDNAGITLKLVFDSGSRSSSGATSAGTVPNN